MMFLIKTTNNCIVFDVFFLIISMEWNYKIEGGEIH